MALVTAFGLYTGKLGDKVYFVRNGKQYVRSVPESKDRPASPAQVAQKQKFKLASELAGKLLEPVIRIGYQGNRKLHPRSEFIRHLLKDVVKGSYPDSYYDYSQLIISRGEKRAPYGIKAAMMGQRMVLSWSSNTDNERAFNNDQLMLVLLNETGEHYIENRLGERDVEYATTLIPKEFTQKVHGWVLFYNADSFSNNINNVSNSVYLGEF